MTKRVVPPIGRFGGVGDVQKRLRGSEIIYDNRDNIAEAMLGLAAAKITDVVNWQNGSVTVKDVADISENALAAIKKIKVTPTPHGDQLEVELVDKVRVMQMLAKSAGLLDVEKAVDKPSIVSIEMLMPEDEQPKKKAKK